MKGLEARSSPAFVVDESKVASHLRVRRHELEDGPLGFILPRFARVSLLGTVTTVLVPALMAGDMTQIIDPSTPLFWTRWLLPTISSIPMAITGYRRTRKQVSEGPAPFAAQIQKNWDQVAGKGWVRRVLLTATAITAGIGGIVGLLLATLWPLSDMPGGSRLLGFLGFVGLTALWVFPMAFGLRALFKSATRRFLSPVSVSEAELE